jgi:OOP family OmpA-OmpF porin
VEEAMHTSIQKDPQRLADILFPVMGPAIRKAVSEDLKRMIAAINTTLESGFSPKTLKWRLQALTSKRSFTEILMANSYVYHVSHIFLIHRDTGILLHEEQAKESRALEADLISSMLTAIRDFVSDSFKSSGAGTLDEVQVGDLNILVEQGPYAVVAAIIEGRPPADYRLTLSETIEAVHFNQGTDLEKFDGNTSIFQLSAKFLQNCLIKQKKQTKSKPPYLVIVLFVAFLAGITYFLVQRQLQHNKLNAFADQLERTPGYHLTSRDFKGNTIYIKGLRDVMSDNPNDISDKMNIENRFVHFDFESYISTDSGIIIQRAIKALSPPASVQISLRDQTLIITGEASEQWKTKALTQQPYIYGINSIDTEQLTSGTNLQWIIPAIEKHRFDFEINVVNLTEQQQVNFDSLVQAALFLDEFNQMYQKRMAIYVQSFTTKSGNLDANLKVANQRIIAFISLLEKAGVNSKLLVSQVKFAEDLTESVNLRSVRFSVFDNKQANP